MNFDILSSLKIIQTKHAYLIVFFQLGNNTITITFESPVKYAQSHYKKHIREHGYAVKPERLVSAFRGEDQVHFIRKTQSSFSWDWGNLRYRLFPFLYKLLVIGFDEILFLLCFRTLISKFWNMVN